MKTYLIAILLIVLTSRITGCTAGSEPQRSEPEQEDSSEDPEDLNPVSDPDDSSEDPVAPDPVSDADDLSWVFETPADPIHVAVALDSSKTVEAVIPIEGGMLSATGADGTVYTLEIPADALLEETRIGMTPVTSISGMPFGSEQTYAVQLSPDGLSLYNIAILTITPAEAIPIEEQIVFGYQAEGQNLILAPPVVDSGEIKIQVLHFSGNGVTKGLTAR